MLQELCHNTRTLSGQATDVMTENKLSKEERILRIMRRVLTNIAKDTYTRPGYRHPLADDTVDDIRQCLGLISAREHELGKAAGRESKARPRFVDEPETSVVVPLIMPEPKDKD